MNLKGSPPYEGGVARVFCVTGWFSMGKPNRKSIIVESQRTTPSAEAAATPPS